MNNVTIYFQRYFWFCDPSFDGTSDDVINLLICITQELKYLWKGRRYFKMENAILHDFEMSFKWALFIFYFIGTLNRNKEQLYIFVVSGARWDISVPFLSYTLQLGSCSDWISIRQHLLVQGDLNHFVYVLFIYLFVYNFLYHIQHHTNVHNSLEIIIKSKNLNTINN